MRENKLNMYVCVLRGEKGEKEEGSKREYSFACR